jgi:hypothetical protein
MAGRSIAQRKNCSRGKRRHAGQLYRGEHTFQNLTFQNGSNLKRAPPSSQAKLAMRAKAHEFEAVVIRLAVDENEIRSDVAVAVIAPFAGQWVISKASSFLLCRPDFSRW